MYQFCSFDLSSQQLCRIVKLHIGVERMSDCFCVEPVEVLFYCQLQHPHWARYDLHLSSPDSLPFSLWLMETKLFPRIPKPAPNRNLNWQHKAQPVGAGQFPKGILFLSTRLKNPKEKKTNTYPSTYCRCPNSVNLELWIQKKFYTIANIFGIA